MKDIQSLTHTTWDCRYHLVWIPKCRKEILYGHLRKNLGDIFRELALQRESRVIEGHLVKDHMHMLISIPPKYAVSQVVGYIKGKSVIAVVCQCGGRKRDFKCKTLWVHGYAVPTAGLKLEQAKRYIHSMEPTMASTINSIITTIMVRWSYCQSVC